MKCTDGVTKLKQIEEAEALIKKLEDEISPTYYRIDKIMGWIYPIISVTHNIEDKEYFSDYEIDEDEVTFLIHHDEDVNYSRVLKIPVEIINGYFEYYADIENMSLEEMKAVVTLCT